VTAKAYCVYADVASFLGVTLTSAQQARATDLIASTTLDVDNETNRGWLVCVQTAERHERATYWHHDLYVRYAPIASVQSITGRGFLGDVEATLVADTDFEIVSLEAGLIRLLYPWSWERVLVSYTPVDTVPLPIRDATAEWVAAKMLPSLRPDTYGIESYSLPDLSVRFSKSVTESIPQNVADTLAKYRYGVAP